MIELDFHLRSDNTINIIYPYRKHNTWVFDDESRGLKAEPFVFGMSKIIDIIAYQVLCDRKIDKFKLIFSRYGMPEFHAKLIKLKDKSLVGAWYKLDHIDTPNWIERHPKWCERGWLCPATLLYFREYPEHIYLYLEKC